MIKILNQSRQPVAVLENAYDISYEKGFNQLWLSSFSLPLDDEKNDLCKPLYFVEVYDNGEYVGLFRIMPKETMIDESGNRVTYQCEHVLATLLDSSIFKYRQIDGLPTKQSIEYVLSFQHTKHWVMGTCEITRYFSYKFENDNLLSSLFSIPKPFDQQFQWTFDTTVYPWKLNLIIPATEPTCEIKEGKNLRGLTLTEDPMGIYNRIYPLGYGEGDNQLTIESVNNGVPYIEDATSVAKYGVRMTIWSDKRFEDAVSLKASAQALMNKWKEVIASWVISAADLSSITGESIDKLRMGNIVRLTVPTLKRTVDLRIVKEKKSDTKGDPGAVELEIGNKTEDLGTTQADIERRQQINELYSQGATNLGTYSFNGNCDEDDPATIKFYLPDEMVRINKLWLTYETTNFRAYSKAAKSTTATLKTTKSGGSTTTSSGGGQTSSSSGNHVHKMFSATGFSAASNPNNSVALRCANNQYIYVDSDTAAGIEYYTEGSSGTHAHEVYDHTHNVPDHQHDFEIPGHGHDLIYGIYKHATLPTKITIKVDGNLVPGTSLEGENLDLIPYLSKDSEGNINRGWHTIELFPDDLGRINANVLTQFFIQSRGGGNF